MKYFVTILFSLFFTNALTAETITREDLRNTLLHMKALVQEQSVQLSAAQTATQQTQEQLAIVQDDLKLAESETAQVKLQIVKLQTFADQETKRANSEHQNYLEAKANLDKTLAKYHKLKFYIASLAALFVAYLVFSLAGLLPVQYRAVASVIGGAIAFTLVFSIF